MNVLQSRYTAIGKKKKTCGYHRGEGRGNDKTGLWD